MRNLIPLEIKKKCLNMADSGLTPKEVYDQYFKQQFQSPQAFHSFKTSLSRWRKLRLDVLDNITLECGTYDGFVPHDATVQVSANGEIIQAWIKQKASDIDPSDFLKAIKEAVVPYEYKPKAREDSSDMLEIPLFDMHWGISFMDHYKPVLDEILEIIASHKWKMIVIPFGQDYFHNDSIINGTTTKGTPIEKVDMQKAVAEGRQFIYAIIDTAISHADEVKVLYSMGNHDRSISWMFMQVLLERYGPQIVDDSMAYRKVITFGSNAIMVTHGDSKRSTPRNLANIFPAAFPEEFARTTVREVHSGHLHHEGEADMFGVMIRRLSTGAKIDDWTDEEDFIGSHRRFMLFNWGSDKLKAIYYI